MQERPSGCSPVLGRRWLLACSHPALWLAPKRLMGRPPHVSRLMLICTCILRASPAAVLIVQHMLHAGPRWLLQVRTRLLDVCRVRARHFGAAGQCDSLDPERPEHKRQRGLHDRCAAPGCRAVRRVQRPPGACSGAEVCRLREHAGRTVSCQRAWAVVAVLQPAQVVDHQRSKLLQICKLLTCRHHGTVCPLQQPMLMQLFLVDSHKTQRWTCCSRATERLCHHTLCSVDWNAAGTKPRAHRSSAWLSDC